MKKVNSLMVILIITGSISGFSLKKERHKNPQQFIITFPVLSNSDYVPSLVPVEKDKITRLSSGFGQRIHPITNKKQFHRGVDIAAPKGAEVYATAKGEVISVKTDLGGYGKHIKIRHGKQYVTHYAQLSDFKVKTGDLVVKGQLIGHVGSSGASTAPHLHYEIIKDGKHVDPENYFEYRSK
ncbi:M23 family metallopeptidase [Fulvivirgaceae bacterium BMA10]|uniref:M23 family metallopeptidase n=1 Tax=Splendidivirga corallicola TaxID=3051826 RepID=A0ABT8KZK2_9BACT|nr:M23 family metallopeptidase [Fulvivirgaceae bacterium BMA10]